MKSCLITKKTLVVVAYRFNIEGLLELNAEAPIFVQLNEPVAHTSIVVAPAALPGRLSSSEYDISYVHNSKIKLVHILAQVMPEFTKKSGMTFAKKGHIERLKFAGTEINQHSGKT